MMLIRRLEKGCYAMFGVDLTGSHIAYLAGSCLATAMIFFFYLIVTQALEQTRHSLRHQLLMTLAVGVIGGLYVGVWGLREHLSIWVSSVISPGVVAVLLTMISAFTVIRKRKAE